MRRARGRETFPQGQGENGSSGSTVPPALLGFYRLLTRKKAPQQPSTSVSSSSPQAPRRKTSSTIGRFLRNPFRRAPPPSPAIAQDPPTIVEPAPPATPPRRALSLRNRRTPQPTGEPATPTASTTSVVTVVTVATELRDLEASASDMASPTSVSRLPLLAPVMGQLRRRELDSMHLRSASVPVASAIRLPQELYSCFLFGCVFKRATHPDTHEYLTYFVKVTEVKLAFFLTDTKGEPPVFSILLTELDPPVVKALDPDDGNGDAALEQACSLYSHGDPIADLLGPSKEIGEFLVKLDLSLDLVMSTAMVKSGGAARSLKDTYQVDIERSVGGYSFVKSGTHRTTETPVVIKFLPKQKNRPVAHGLPMEVDLLQRLKHESIIELKGIYESADYFVMVMLRLGDGLDLFEYLQRVERVHEAAARRIMTQVISAVCYLADQGVVHGDIKDENIILDASTMTIKLIDFGSSRPFTLGEPFAEFTGTRYIACPEIIAQEPYDPLRQEAWSLGVLLYIILIGEYPFAAPEDIVKGQVKAIAEGLRGSVTLQCWALMEMLLDAEATGTPDLAAIAAHPWIA